MTEAENAIRAAEDVFGKDVAVLTGRQAQAYLDGYTTLAEYETWMWRTLGVNVDRAEKFLETVREYEETA